MDNALLGSNEKSILKISHATETRKIRWAVNPFQKRITRRSSVQNQRRAKKRGINMSQNLQVDIHVSFT